MAEEVALHLDSGLRALGSRKTDQCKTIEMLSTVMGGWSAHVLINHETVTVPEHA